MTVPSEFQKGGVYFEIYQRIFKLHLKHFTAYTDGDWKALADDIVEPMLLYERKLVTEIVCEIERVYKGGTVDAKDE